MAGCPAGLGVSFVDRSTGNVERLQFSGFLDQKDIFLEYNYFWIKNPEKEERPEM